MCQEILTPRTKPIQPPCSLSFPILLMAYLYLIYTLWHFFSLWSCSFTQFNVNTSSVGFFIFFSVILWPPHLFFICICWILSSIHIHTYRHHCIYASQDLNIQCSELSIDTFFSTCFFSFLTYPILHCPGQRFIQLHQPRFVPLCYLCISTIFTFAFQIRLLVYGPHDVKTSY